MSIPGIEEVDELGGSEPAARAVTLNGDILLLVPGRSAAARAAAHAQADDVVCVMEITDVAPVSVPHRIRGRAWVAGWLTTVRDEERAACAMLLAEQHPVGEVLALAPEDAPAPGHPGPARPTWTLLRLEVSEACVDDLWGAEHADPEELAEAAPDPLAAHEAELLQHLHAAHSEQVSGLTALLGPRAARSAHGRPPVPVALDRFGLRVRFTGADGRPFDARFDFPEPVRDICELRRAMHMLFAGVRG
ncbi:DUF2470 domain-containing protein [Streptomyces sp. SAJ15]|uniref:DUF2470 domain-containing protein n=1 Tax=Streptomyces sp. SAJ15 TaxID=2011095 RepID=UPI00135D4597|nr:DUF2470 domain-containing protein [Streptomyces sp. SAJ15]TVL93177.1 DUF2470 domain-containing protein [Streptomyces sp. SAJ15]